MLKTTKKAPTVQASLLVIFSLLLQAVSLPLLVKAAPNTPAVIYVDVDAVSGANTGASWADAFTNLQPALASATSGVQIWVAEGTYKPTSTTDRTLSFAMKNGVAIYGGFAGTETDLVQRDWLAHPTILSGNIGDSASAEDNSNHVVTSQNTDETAILDGFTIRDGYANSSSIGSGIYGSNAGGILVLYGNPILGHLSIISNYAAGWGGGLYSRGASETSLNTPSLSDITIKDNVADNLDDFFLPAGSGGGMATLWSSPTLTRVDFIHNITVDSGGGYFNYDGNPSLNQVQFEGNFIHRSFGGGGGMASTGNVNLLNVSFTNNSAQVGGGFDAGAGKNILNLRHVTFTGNSASNRSGGMNLNGATATLVDLTFTANTADFGGGMGVFLNSTLHVINASFIGNHAGQEGGAMISTESSALDLTNAVFSGNQAPKGGAVYFDIPSQYLRPRFDDSTFSSNQASLQGGAIYSNTAIEPVVINSILWGDSAPQGPEIYLAGDSSLIALYSDIQGGWAGDHTIDANPLFRQPLGPDGIAGTPDDNLRLLGISPAVDVGSNDLVPVDYADVDCDGVTFGPLPYDRDNNRRIIRANLNRSAIVDLGAYEAPENLLFFIPDVVKE